jgi:UDP-glucuronate 4-epimerase
MKNILITGGAGFIGSHLVDSLLKESDTKITVVDNFDNFYHPLVKHANINCHLFDPNFTLASGSILNERFLDEVFASDRFDCVVHLAARAGVRPSLSNPKLYEETNIRGTLNLLEAVRNYRVEQFVFGSSSSVYGDNSRSPFNEDDAVDKPVSPYAATKAAGELLCHTYSHLYNFRAVCLRFFTVYGPRQRPDLAIHKFARLISARRPIPLYGDGTSRRDYTFVGDIIQGVRAAIDYCRSDFEIFNLGESKAVELNRLITLLESALGQKAVIEKLPPQPGDVRQTCADISKAEKLLNYRPQIPIEEGIGLFADWFREQTASKLKTRVLEAASASCNTQPQQTFEKSLGLEY